MGRNSRVGYVADRKLIPRIKEYIAENNGVWLEADEVATALQAEYSSEYGRKNKAAFRSSVAKALKLLKKGGGCGQSEAGVRWEKEEGNLQALESHHVEKKRREEGEGGGEEMEEGVPDEPVGGVWLEEEGEEGEGEEVNMLNDSLLQIYRRDDSTRSPHTLTSDVTNSTPSTPEQKVGSESGSGTGDSPVIISWDDSCVEGSLMMSQGEAKDVGENPMAVVGSEGNPLDTTDSSNVTHHVTSGDGHVTSVEQQPEGGGMAASCGGVEGREGAVESERKLKKVTFAPDVMDKQTTSILKSPGVPRKRRHKLVEAGEGEGGSAGQKKHRSHRSRSGKSEKNVGGKEGEGEANPAVERALRERHSKSQFQVERSSVTFADIGGCQTAIEGVQKLLLHMRHPAVFSRLGICPPQGVLLHGPPGCGKTLLASAIAGEMRLPLIRLAATEIVSGVSGESEGSLRDLFSLAKGSVPCVLFIDDVDVICLKRETAQREMEKRIVSQLLACVDYLHSSSEGSGVLLVAATTRPDSLDPAVRRSGRFDREICLGIPDEPARLSILQVLMRGLRLEPDFPLQDLAHRTPGYVGADLRALIREASLCAVNRLLSTSGRHALSTPVGGASPGSEVTGSTVTPEEGAAPGPLTENRNPSFENRDPQSLEGLDDIFITAKDFELALQEVQPSAKREGFATVPGTSWDDVGALEDVREELTLAILAPVRYPRQFADLGLTTPPGILLAGPPGCGKTLLAKAIANESGINFISVKGPELLNMYVGESERAVRQVFQRARNSAPCVIFFDELDALCPRRSEMAEASASSRVVNQLLTEMDGLQARRQVFIMAATNRPDIIDPAVLRPGRLDRVVYVGLPSSRDRSLILNTITKNGTRPRTRNVDMSTLASSEYTEGFSGADLKSLVREAAIAALKQHMHLSSNWLTPDQSDRTSSLLPAVTKVGGASEGAKVDGEECIVTMENFVSALKRVKPSVSGKDRLFYESMRDQFSCSKTS